MKSPANNATTVLAKVAVMFHATPAEVKGEAKASNLLHARAVIAMTLKEQGWSYPRIGRFLGDRDHTTVMHMVRRFPHYCAQDSRVAQAKDTAL